MQRSEASELNKAFYDRFPPGRDDYWRLMAAPRHRCATLIQEIRTASPANLADLGCGNGVFLQQLQPHLPGASLLGVDLSSVQIAANRESHPDIRWIVLDLDGPADLGEHEASFDVVVAMEVIEHVDRPATFLRNARSLARPGVGRLYLSTQSGPIRTTEVRVGHRRHYSRQEMSALLEQNGWDPIRVWNTGFPFHDLSKWWTDRFPDASMARFDGSRYGIRARLICWALRVAFRFNSRSRGAQLYAVASRVD